jgi:hypothetical protein
MVLGVPGFIVSTEYGRNRGRRHQELSFRETFPWPRNGVANHRKMAKRGSMKRFALLSILVAFGLAACERHEFDGPDGTKRLHGHGEPHAEHSADEAAH